VFAKRDVKHLTSTWRDSSGNTQGQYEDIGAACVTNDESGAACPTISS